MKDFKKHGSFGKKPFRSGGGRDFNGPREMFKAECSKCHDLCEVPFRPNGKKPVFCSNCFVKDGDDAPRGNFERRSFSPRPSFRDNAPVRTDAGMEDMKRELRGMNEKLDRLVSLMEASLVRSVAASAPVQAAPKKAKVAKKAAPKKKK